MKKKTKIIIGIAAIIVAIPVGLYIAGCYYYTDARTYEANWNINLPRTVKEEYSNWSEPDFHGDGYAYTVFSYDDTDVNFTGQFEKGENTGMEKQVCDILQDLNVDEDEYPDFSHAYSWYEKKYLWDSDNGGGDHFWMVYDDTTHRLFAIQSTM
jgi:hypothetical protein